MEFIQINGKAYEVSGRASDGLPILKATTATTQDGYDAEGNPILYVSVMVPPALIGAIPGQNGE